MSRGSDSSRLDDFPGETLHVDEAARCLRCSRNALYESIRRGDFEGAIIRVGSRILLSKRALRCMLGEASEAHKPRQQPGESRVI